VPDHPADAPTELEPAPKLEKFFDVDAASSKILTRLASLTIEDPLVQQRIKKCCCQRCSKSEPFRGVEK
jgi:hypothetical protein